MPWTQAGAAGSGVATVFPLSEVVGAHTAVESGSRRGKIVLVV